jgi:hypothetical protein
LRFGNGSVFVTKLAGGLGANVARSPVETWLGVKGSGLLGCVHLSGFALLHVTTIGEMEVCSTTLVLPDGTFSTSAQTAKSMFVSLFESNSAHALPA